MIMIMIKLGRWLVRSFVRRRIKLDDFRDFRDFRDLRSWLFKAIIGWVGSDEDL